MTKLFRCEYCEANDKVLFTFDVIQRRVSPDLPLDIQKSEINIPPSYPFQRKSDIGLPTSNWFSQEIRNIPNPPHYPAQEKSDIGSTRHRH